MASGPSFEHLPSPVAARLKAYHRRKQLFQALRVAFSAAIVYLVLALAAMHLDRFLFLRPETRVRMSLAVHASAGLFLLAGLVRFARRRTRSSQVAYELESRLPPETEERFVTLDNLLERRDFLSSPIATELVQELEAATIRTSEGLRPARLVRDPALRLLATGFVFLAALTTFLALDSAYEFPLMAERFLSPGRPLPKPSFIKIHVTPERLVVGRGGEAVLQARISGRIPVPWKWMLNRLGVTPGRCTLAFEEEAAAGGGAIDRDRAVRADMVRMLRDTFLFTRADLQQSFRYGIRCGDAETEVRAVEVIAQPRILDLRLTATPPAYSGLPEVTLQDFRQPLQFLPGTKILLSFRADQPVPTRLLRFDKARESVEPDWDEQALSGHHGFILKQKTELEITVTNARGFSNVERVRAVLGLREDAAPVARLDWPSSDLEKVPSELVPVQAAIEDDLGIAEVVLRFTLNPTPEEEIAPQEIPIPLEKSGLKSVPVSALFDLDQTRAVPGDTVAFRLRARDTAGNDGLSREMLVRVVSFTRGENERHRLAALRLVRDAFAEAAGPAEDSTARPSVPALGKDAYDRLTKLAASLQIPLPAEPSLHSFARVLEMEHHFTDDPRHKEDLRCVSGLVRYAAAPFPAAGSPLSGDESTRLLRSLAEEVLPSLSAYRQLKNLAWRLFGMRAEVLQIRGQLQETAAEKKADSDGASSVKRRAELYLKTLQDIGDELIGVSRSAPRALDPVRTRGLVGDLNTAAYYLGRGSLARRQSSCEKVAELIPRLLVEVRGAFLPLLEQEQAARARLHLAFESLLDLVAARPPDAAWTPEALDRAIAWLDADARLLGRQPFSPFWPRVVSFALASELARGRPGGPATEIARAGPAGDFHHLVHPPEAWSENVRLERLAAEELAFLSHLDTLLGMRGLSTTEMLMELTLLELEKTGASGNSPSPEREALASRLSSLDMDSGVPADEITKLRARTVEVAAAALGHLPTATRALAEAASLSFSSSSPEASLEALAARFRETAGMLEEASKIQKAGDTDALGRHIALAARRVALDVEGAERLIEQLFFRLTLLPPGDAETGRRDDVLLLHLREALGRYEARARPHEGALEGAAGHALDAGQLASLHAETASLQLLHRSLAARLDSLLADSRGGNLLGDQELVRFGLMKELDRTRLQVDTTASLISGSGDALEAARNFLEKSPEALWIGLQAQAPSVESARMAIERAREALRRPDPDAAEAGRQVAEARGRLEPLHALQEQAGGSEAPAAVVSSLTEAVKAMARISGPPEAAGPAGVQARLYALEEILRRLDRLAADLEQPDLAADPESETAWRGGPDDLWTKAYRQHAEKARQRLLGQAARARQAIALGVLETVRPQPNPDRFVEASGWSLFLFRLARSGLAGSSGMRPAPASEDPSGDPHLKFLRVELEKARKVKDLRNYAAPTKEYLDSLADFLRY
ncbi:MAG: hypothetical protein HYU36_17720 [Planctomycetes bacterium]|nr:hypothetical protein [Planctomycetota bacterium]